MTHMYPYPAPFFPIATIEKVCTGPPRMQQTECTGEYGRRVIRREWRNTRGELHRTTGPAVENWTVLPGGAHVLSYQVWYLNGRRHWESRPAWRSWHVKGNGTRVLVTEEWYRHGVWHRVGGPAYRSWHVEPDGTRTLTWEEWCVNGKLQRVDGPAIGRQFCWHGETARQEDLPWLRRGRDLLNALTEATGTPHGAAMRDPPLGAGTHVWQ